MRKVNMIKKKFAFIAVAALLSAGCTEDAVITPEPEKPSEEKTEEVAEQIVFNNVVQLHYEHDSSADFYYIALASSDVIFDEEAFCWKTAEDGYVMLMTLKAAPAADPTLPELPAGEYAMSASGATGIWDVSGQNEIIYCEQGGEPQLLIPEEGALEVTVSGRTYKLSGTCRTEDGQSFEFSFSGRLKFEGLSSSITEPIDTEFIGGQALFFGEDELHPELDYIRIELWDAEPDPVTGQIPGNFIKCKIYVERLESVFRGVPAGTYVVSSDKAEAFVAEAGYDDGVNLPTGTYISSRNSGRLQYSMITSGSLTVSETGTLEMDFHTSDDVSVKGRLDVPLELLDLSGREEIDDTPYFAASTLQNDVDVDLSGVKEAYFVEYGDKFGNGTRNVVLQLIDEEKLEALVFDLNMPGGEVGDPLAEGTYNVNEGTNEAFTYAPGMMMMGNTIGSYYCNLEWHSSDGQEYYLAGDAYGPVASGTVKVEHHGEENYTLTVDWLDNALSPHRITSVWSGVLKSYSYGWNQ